MAPRKPVEVPETSLILDDGRHLARWAQAPNVRGHSDPWYAIDSVLGLQLVAVPTGGECHVVVQAAVDPVTGLPIAEPPVVESDAADELGALCADETPTRAPIFARPHVDVDPFTRDGYGRPLIEQTDGTTEPYTRASRLASFVDDDSGLARWRQRMTMLGLMVRPDLVEAVRTTDPADRGALGRIADQALEAGGGRDASARGTAIHREIERLIRDGVTPATGPDVDDALAGVGLLNNLGLKALAVELPIVNHELRAAGTADLLAQGPSRTLIVDHKTSGNADAAKYGALSWSIQVAAYATGAPYVAGQGATTWQALGLPTPDRERGLVLHIQQGTASARAFSVDLVRGLEAARLATHVRDARSLARELLIAL